MSFEKVPESSWTGTNTKTGQILLIKVNALNNAAMNVVGGIADMMYITLQTENILEIRDTACSIYD